VEQHAAQAPALRERHPQIVNVHYGSGLSGLGHFSDVFKDAV